MPEIVGLTEDQIRQWEEDIEQARALRATVASWWDANVEAYAPKPSDDPSDYGSKLNTNRDFTLVERKKADLFYQVPDVQAVPQPLMVGNEAILDVHTDILNAKVGIYGVDGKDLVHRVLFDVLCPAGTGFTVMGYEQFGPMMGDIDPTTGQPVSVQVPVHADIFWKWISPKQVLIPASYRSTRWDDAPWLGFEFEWPLAVVKAKGWVPETFRGDASKSDELYFDYGTNPPAASGIARGTVIFYKSSLYRPDRPHPLHQSMLVFIDGIDTPVEHKDSPYQTLTEQGTLTPDSLIGFPMHPLTIRSMSDTAYVPSDCTLSRPIVNELNRFRGQMIEQRDANSMRWMYNTGTLPPDAVEKFTKSPIGGMIGVPPEAFEGEGAIKELPHGTFPRENFTFNDYLDNDLARTHALDANQAGADAGGDQTATEANLRQSNTNARLGLERNVVLDWWVKGCAKYSTLLMRFLSLPEAAAIVGPEKAQAWDAWRHTVPATLAFTALPDSALRHDLASERKRALDEYAFFAKDPAIDKMALLKHLLPKLHYPQSVLVQQQAPKSPEPPKITLSIGAADLDPMAPAYGNIYQILTQQGVKNLSAPTVDPMTAHAIQAETQMQADAAKHPGKMAQSESLSKHQVDETGGMQGTGQPMSMGAM